MKHLMLWVTLVFTSTSAFAASTYYDVDEELETAVQLIQQEKYKQAIDTLENAVDSEPDNADAWNLLGYASRKIGDLEQSAEAYSKALSIDPKHLDALEYQGELFLMLGDKTSAEGNLAELKSLCPNGCEQLEMLTKAIAAHQ